MVGTSTTSSSSSSIASFSSFDDLTIKPTTPTSVIKLICSCWGKILPRRGKLRYVGGETRVLTVDRNITFLELQAKLGKLCGLGHVTLRCQLPSDDLDTLVSINSNEDLANLYEEYVLAAGDLMHPIKIKAFLSPPRPLSPKHVVTESYSSKFSVSSQMSMARTAGYPSSRSHYDCPAYSLRTMHHGNHW